MGRQLRRDLAEWRAGLNAHLIRKAFEHCRRGAVRPHEGRKELKGGGFTLLTLRRTEGRGTGGIGEDSRWRWSVSHTCSRRDLWAGRGLEDSVCTWLTLHCELLGERGSNREVDVFHPHISRGMDKAQTFSNQADLSGVPR